MSFCIFCMAVLCSILSSFQPTTSQFPSPSCLLLAAIFLVTSVNGLNFRSSDLHSYQIHFVQTHKMKTFVRLLRTTLLVNFIRSCGCYSPSIRRWNGQRTHISSLHNPHAKFTPVLHQKTYNKHYLYMSLPLKSSTSVQDDVTQRTHSDNHAEIIMQSDGTSDTNKESELNKIKSTVTLSPAAQWHQNRHLEMMQKYRSQIQPLERDSCSNILALSLLAISNISLLYFALLCGQLSIPKVILLSIFPGSMFSLWTLQILHDCLHGSLFPKQSTINLLGRPIRRKSLQNLLLFIGSMPSAFGYYLYLKFGHLSHHKSLGDAASVSLKTLFDSDRKNLKMEMFCSWRIE